MGGRSTALELSSHTEIRTSFPTFKTPRFRLILHLHLFFGIIRHRLQVHVLFSASTECWLLFHGDWTS